MPIDEDAGDTLRVLVRLIEGRHVANRVRIEHREVGFLLIDTFPVLLALEAAIISLVAVMRWRTIRRVDSRAAAA